MRDRNDRISERFGLLKRFSVSALLAVLLPVMVGLTGLSATASAAYHKGFGSDLWVKSSMGPIKNRVFRAADGSTNRVVIALDGLRATTDISGWEHETEIAGALTRAGFNVVMPVGGHSSFYADWQAPSAGKFYKWETYLTGALRGALGGQGFKTSRMAVIGLSMGGGAAVNLARWHPDMFSFASSMSGYLNTTAPGVSLGIGAAMRDEGGFDVNAMWGPPGSPAWYRNDPTVQAGALSQIGTRLWISAGTGIPGVPDFAGFDQLVNLPAAVALEGIAQIQTRAFQVAYTLAGGHNAVFSYPAIGTHRWMYWEQQVFQMIPDMRAHTG